MPLSSLTKLALEEAINRIKKIQREDSKKAILLNIIHLILKQDLQKLNLKDMMELIKSFQSNKKNTHEGDDLVRLETYYLYACCLLEGYGIKQNVPAAIEIFKYLLNTKTHSFASYHLGSIYLQSAQSASMLGNEKFVAVVRSKIKKYYSISLQDWYGWMLYEVGLINHKACKELKDEKYQYYYLNLTIHYMCLAADKNYAPAQELLGEQFAYFLNTMNNQNINAIFWVARCYEFGLGVKRDLKKAAASYLHSISDKSNLLRENILACVRMAHTFKNGVYQDKEPIEVDYGIYFQLIKQLSAIPSEYKVTAEIELAKCYYLGRGVQKNLPLAKSLFEKLMKQQHDPVVTAHVQKYFADFMLATTSSKHQAEAVVLGDITNKSSNHQNGATTQVLTASHTHAKASISG